MYFRKGDYLTASDLKQQVTNFVKTNNLQAEDNKRSVMPNLITYSFNNILQIILCILKGLKY